MATGSLILVGWAYWTLLEYLLHRFAFHRRHPTKFMGRRHVMHHADLEDRGLTRAPLPTYLVGLAAHLLLFRLLFGAAAGFPLFAGFAIGAVLYETVHYGVHWFPRLMPRRLVGYHLSHHARHPNARFGVTTRIWDWVFGTR